MRYAVFMLAAITASAWTGEAFAHAEEPNARGVFPVEGGWVLRANFGIVGSDQPTRLVCEEAFLGGDGWLLGVLGPTEWLTFGESTIQRTEDGCTFETVDEVPVRPSDATVDAENGHAAYVINGETDAGGVYLSVDRGQTFRGVDGIDAGASQLTGVRFLDADTLIVSGYLRDQNGASALWRVDVGSYTATGFSPPADTTFPYVLAARADEVVLLARRDAQTVFWGPPDNLARDEVEVPSWPTGALLSGDGQTVWVSGTNMGKGVLVGTRDGGPATWETIAADTTANCIAGDAETLYVCGLNRNDGFDVQSIAVDGSIEGVLDFGEFVGARECPDGSDVAGVCPLVWEELAPYFGVDPANTPDAGATAPDAGPPDAGETDDGADPAMDDRDRPASGSGCCATVRAKGESWFPTGLCLVVVLFVSRRLTRAR